MVPAPEVAWKLLMESSEAPQRVAAEPVDPPAVPATGCIVWACSPGAPGTRSTGEPVQGLTWTQPVPETSPLGSGFSFPVRRGTAQRAAGEAMGSRSRTSKSSAFNSLRELGGASLKQEEEEEKEEEVDDDEFQATITGRN